MCQNVKESLDGEGGIDPTDRYGFFTETGQVQLFLTGFGMKYFELDQNGKPQFVFLDNSESFTRLEKLITVLNDRDLCHHVNNFTGIPGYNNRWAAGRGLFTQDRHLFTISGALCIAEFSEMESEFGMLPMPKYDADQSRYYHTIDNASPMFAIPATKADTEDLGMMLEAFSYEGMNILTPVFREKLLERRYTRDAESLEMLEIIFSTKSFDFSTAANFGGVTSIATNAVDNEKMPTASQYDKIKDKITQAIDKDYNAFLTAGKGALDTTAEE